MKTTTINMNQVHSDELLTTIDSIQGLLVLAQYHQNRSEMDTYLVLISTCILKVEEIVRNASQSSVQPCNGSVL
jgi:hypothetical protein